jgi:hypothetical protein
MIQDKHVEIRNAYRIVSESLKEETNWKTKAYLRG